MKEIFELLKQVLNREFIRAVLSNPRTKDGVVKAKSVLLRKTRFHVSGRKVYEDAGVS